MWTAKLLRICERLFRWLLRSLTQQPYKGVPWAIIGYALISCLIYTHNGPFSGHILGFDDHVRMTQVLQWVNGGGWYDRLITRVNAPDGFQTIWSRIVDIPLAAIIIAAKLLVDQHTAALTAAVIMPMVELVLMFVVARYFARPLAGKKEAWLVTLFVMFTTVMNAQPHTMAGFHLGEIGHHAWYGILNVLMFGAVVRIALGVAGPAPQVMLGLAIGLLLAVGIEGIPMIAGTAAILSFLAWAFQKERLACRGAISFGLGSLVSQAMLPLHVPLDHWLEISFAQPSLLGPILTATASAFLGLQSIVQRNIKGMGRTAALLGISVIIIARLLIIAFPDLLAGGTAALSPSERQMVAQQHYEVWSLHRLFRDPVDFMSLLMPSLLAISTGVIALLTTGNTRRRRMYAAHTSLAILSGGLAQIYWRYIHHAQSAACPLLLHAWQRIRARLPHNKKLYGITSLVAFFAFGPLWFLLLPALNAHQPFLSHIALFPGKLYAVPLPCDALSLTRYLNQHYAPQIIINVPEWDSATFLFETNLKIDFLSNYPSQDHFIDNQIFFQKQDVEAAKKVALRHGFSLVAACKSIVTLPPELIASRPYREPFFIERLREGTPPSWLKPVKTDIRTDYLLFEVDPTALK